MQTVVRYLLIAATLLLPGTIVLMVVAAVCRFIYKRLKMTAPSYLPVRTPSGALLYTWQDWHRDAKADHPVRYFLTETLPERLASLRGWIQSVWTRFLDIFRRPHMLDMRSSGYRGGRVSADEAMLYVCFSIFERFVKTDGGDLMLALPDGWEDDPIGSIGYQKRADLQSLYKWWTVDRPREHATLAAMPGGEHKAALRYGLVESDQLHLARLIESRLMLS